MIPEIGSGVLSADVGYKDEDEEGDQEKGVKEVNLSFSSYLLASKGC